MQAGSFTALPDTRWPELDALADRVDEVEGEGPCILTRDFGAWSIEFMFDSEQRFYADQVRFHPEGVDLDADADRAEIDAMCPWSALDAVRDADAVVGISIDAIHGCADGLDEVVVLLQNGVNLHYQPTEERCMLRLIRSAHGSEQDRALIRQTLPRLRPVGVGESTGRHE